MPVYRMKKRPLLNLKIPLQTWRLCLTDNAKIWEGIIFFFSIPVSYITNKLPIAIWEGK